MAANEMAGAFRARVAVAYLSRVGSIFFFALALSGFASASPISFSLSLLLSRSFSTSKMDDLFDGAVGIDLGTTYS